MMNPITAETIRAEYEHANYYHPNKKFLGHLAKFINGKLPEGMTVEMWAGKKKIDIVNHMTGDFMGYCREDDAIFFRLTNNGKVDMDTIVPPARLAWFVKMDKNLEKKGEALLTAIKEKF